MTNNFLKNTGWALEDLIDFESRLLTLSSAQIAAERVYFQSRIKPHLPAEKDNSVRRLGFKAWLESLRARGVGSDYSDLINIMRSARRALAFCLFFVMAAAGVLLMLGSATSVASRLHVVILLGVTVILPWIALLLIFLIAWLRPNSRGFGSFTMTAVLWTGRRMPGLWRLDELSLKNLKARLLDSRHPLNALRAAAAALMQIGAIGFYTGLILSFLALLLVFDMEFYWEATPQTESSVVSAISVVSTPWAWVWPSAVPDAEQIAASRLRPVSAAQFTPGDATGAWWRFLAMTLLVWGLLPRIMLAWLFTWLERRALNKMEFQTPRYRVLWRSLCGAESGSNIRPLTRDDNAFVLDMGGRLSSVASMRGFFLRVLRLNPKEIQAIDVLDDAVEAAADEALSKRPAHVVVLVEDEAYSPNQAKALYKRMRDRLGDSPAVIWLVYGQSAGKCVAPGQEHERRWTSFVDSLRDSTSEIVAYDPSR